MKKRILISTAILAVGSAWAQTKPIAIYPFNSNANSDIVSINGTVTGATLTEDRFGNPNKAYLFNGVNSNINLGSNTAYAFTNVFTISAWIKWAGKSTGVADGSGIIVNREGEYEIAIDSTGDIMWALSTTSINSWAYTKTGVKVSKNTWNQVVFQYANSLVSIYLNGVLISQVARTGTIDEESANTNTLDDFRIGNRQALAQPFKGAIDLVKIYGAGLTANEISNNYTSESTKPEHFKMAAYAFNNSANDAIGSINGTVNGAVVSDDRFGTTNAAYLFDGSNDYISLGDTNAFAFTNMFTVSTWVKRTGVSNGLDGSAIIINNEGLYELGHSPNGVLGFAVSTTNITSWNWTNTTTVLPLNQWSQLVFIYNGGTVEIYMNGALIGTQSLGGILDEAVAITATQNEFQIGARQGYPAKYNFKGNMDDVAIYNYALSATEVSALYLEEKTLPTGIEDENNTALFSVFPNPTQNAFKLRASKAISSVKMIATSGEKTEVEMNNETISTEKMPQGFYILKVIFEDGTSKVSRISVLR